MALFPCSAAFLIQKKGGTVEREEERGTEILNHSHTQTRR